MRLPLLTATAPAHDQPAPEGAYEAGLVRTRRQGTQICYSIDTDAVRTVADTLALLAGTD